MTALLTGFTSLTLIESAIILLTIKYLKSIAQLAILAKTHKLFDKLALFTFIPLHLPSF
jgi:hypothetical protein